MFDPSFVSLEGISYQPRAVFNHVRDINTSNWSVQSCCAGVFDPGWVQDAAGIVHLQGLALQKSADGPNAGLIATLPPNVWPDRTVYTVVLGAPYADLAIEPDGQILMIAPRTEALRDVGGVWLDGITYQPRQPPRPVPHALSLTRRGDVLTLLHKPRTLQLLVFGLGPRAHLLGAAKLGHAPAGQSRLAWGLRVNGRRLRAGRYIAELVPLPARGSLSEGPSVTFSLADAGGPIRVRSATCSVAAAVRGRC